MIGTVTLWLGSRFQAVRSERGASLVEYGLLVVFIAIVCIAAVAFLGNSLSTGYSTDTSSLFP